MPPKNSPPEKGPNPEKQKAQGTITQVTAAMQAMRAYELVLIDVRGTSMELDALKGNTKDIDEELRQLKQREQDLLSQKKTNDAKKPQCEKQLGNENIAVERAATKFIETIGAFASSDLSQQNKVRLAEAVKQLRNPDFQKQAQRVIESILIGIKERAEAIIDPQPAYVDPVEEAEKIKEEKKPTPSKIARQKIPEKREEMKVHIRWMIRRDMPEVLQTETESFEYAWTEEDFLRCLRQRNCIGMVAEQGEKVVGFMIYELHKNKLKILNFAVHPKVRFSRVGAQMVAKLVSKLSSHRRTKIELEIRETNLDAQLFFQKQEFMGKRVLRGFYEDTGEDAYLMQFRFGDEPDEDDFAEGGVNRIAQYEEEN